jgi:hypothetical protein
MSKYIKETKPDRDQEKQERKDVQEFLSRPDVDAVFKAYEKPLSILYKFYASQDQKNDQAAFDLEYLHSVLSFKEFVRFGYQQNVVPNFITPDDMVTVYKNLVRETEDERTGNDKFSVTHRTSGMIDYESFKKAIIRISVLA